MEIAQASEGNEEVVHWYNRINEKIAESELQPVQHEWVIQLGGKTLVSKFIEEYHEELFSNWKELLRYGVENGDRLFLGVLVSGLRKFMSDDLRREMAEFLTLEDRKLELIIGKNLKIHPKAETKNPLDLEDLDERRQIIHDVASKTLSCQLKFDHHARASTP